MEIEEHKLETEEIGVLEYWKQIPIDDIDALMMYQKIEQTINEFIAFLEDHKVLVKNTKQMHFSYEISIQIRDFTILLRDALLGVAKHEQYKKDAKAINTVYLVELQNVIQNAATEIQNNFKSLNIPELKIAEWKYQNSPIETIENQLIELQKQCKKVYRSISKVDDIRSNIGDYVRDFQLQYSIQTSAIFQLFTLVGELKALTKDVTVDIPKLKLDKIVDQIGNKIQDLEQIQSTESINILPYGEKETISLPVSTEGGRLNFKTINVKSEFARWFSSFIYPKIIELESKRDHAVEKCLIIFRQIQNKIAAIQIADNKDNTEIQKEFDTLFKSLEKDPLGSLKSDEETISELVSQHLNIYLKASNVYSDKLLFLPESSNLPITNISRDAQKRIVNHLEVYQKKTKEFINSILSRYIEVDQTSSSQFIKNKLAINDEDDSQALFLKNGYLGKSFTVPRKDVIGPIVEDYNLWKDGFSGAILLSGLTGSGKSTIIGMLNHLGLNEEIIQLKKGESFFIQHRSYEPICDFKELIDSIIKRTLGKQIIVCIDDLEHWHNDEVELFNNITKLFASISKHRKKIFFVVACSSFLKERLEVFKDLKPIFTYQISVGGMNANQLKLALSLRARVKELGQEKESELDTRLGNIVRESLGNPGMAMLEHCRSYNDEYKSNVKSLEFKELILTHFTLLTYISAYHQISIRFLSNILSEIDFRNTMESIDYLVSQKILIRPKKGYISLNPFLVHAIEKILNNNR